MALSFGVFSLFLSLACGNPIVQTKLGAFEGTEFKIPDGTLIYRFMGIPYAKHPLRFQEPEPITEPFVKTEAKYQIRCLQYMLARNKRIMGMENCLHLNVYTTSLNEAANYDVIVFIHGGGFIFGASYSQTPEYLHTANKKLVFVTINYRLGPLGFLSTEDNVVPGNNGLKDQVVALEWIQQNIRHFGGDPNKVTITGMSAGGISVHLHYLSPLSKNLFARGISMSGAALSPYVKTKNIREEAVHLAKRMGCPTNNSTIIVECLRSVSGEKILETVTNDEIPWEMFNSDVRFGPVIEKGGLKPFLNEHPFHLLRKGKVKNAPWLASVTTAEGLKPAALFVENPVLMEQLNDNWKAIAPYLLMFSNSAPKERLPEVSKMIKEHYMGNEAITIANRDKLIKLVGDRLYMSNIESAVRLHARATVAPVYFYIFDYRGKYSYSSIFSKSSSNLGVSHVDDLLYILKMDKFEPLQQDTDMVDLMVGTWNGFIHNRFHDMLLGKKWPRVPRNVVYSGNMYFMRIYNPTDFKVAAAPDISKRLFWDSLPLDELHLLGDRHVPEYIEKQHKLSLVFRKIIEPVKKRISSFIHALKSLFSRKNN